MVQTSFANGFTFFRRLKQSLCCDVFTSKTFGLVRRSNTHVSCMPFAKILIVILLLKLSGNTGMSGMIAGEVTIGIALAVLADTRIADKGDFSALAYGCVFKKSSQTDKKQPTDAPSML